MTFSQITLKADLKATRNTIMGYRLNFRYVFERNCNFYLFFLEGKVANPAILVVLNAARIFLSLLTTTSLASLLKFINIFRFAG